MKQNVIWTIKKFEELSTWEFHQIVKARIEVFVVEQNCPYPEIDGDDPKALHLWGEFNSEIVAYCRIFEAGLKYKDASIGRVLTSRNFRGQSLGKVLMKIAIATVSARYTTSKIRISAQDYLLSFYTGLGFSATSKSYLEDNIPHTEMFKI